MHCQKQFWKETVYYILREFINSIEASFTEPVAESTIDLPDCGRNYTEINIFYNDDSVFSLRRNTTGTKHP